MISASKANMLSGVASGAAAGSTFGPWGTVIGGVVGGLFGKKNDKQAEQAKMYQQLAYGVQQQREGNAVQEQYLQQIRTARTARAGSLASGISAGISTSSLQTSALSSIGSQSTHNIQFLANDRRLFQLYSQYMQAANAALDKYKNNISLMNVMPGLISTGLGLTKAGYQVGEDIYGGAGTAYNWLTGLFKTEELQEPEVKEL